MATVEVRAIVRFLPALGMFGKETRRDMIISMVFAPDTDLWDDDNWETIWCQWNET